VKSKMKSKAQVGPLRNIQGQEINDPGDMVKSFNAQFVSVFTAKDISCIYVPENMFHGNAEDRLLDFEITAETVKTRLARLREDKSPGSDDLSPRLLKELCED